MGSYNSRWFIVILVAFFIITGSVIMYYPRPSNTMDDEVVENENYSVFYPPLSRPTKAGEAWPMYLNNPQHMSYTTSVGPITDEVSWFNSTNNPTYSSPCVANGKVFIGAEEAMNAFYENNSTLAWRTFTIQPVTGSFGVASSPAYSNGFVYFGGDRIYCLYETNGTIKWTVSPGNYKHGDGSPTIANGKVFIGGSNRKLYCIDQYSGEVLWTFQTLSSGDDNWGLYAAPAVVNGRVYLSACDGFLYQINETQPTIIATAYHIFDMTYASYFSPLVVNGRVYVGCGYSTASTVNRLYCLYESNLTKIWEFYPGEPVSFFCSAGYYDGKIYVGSVGPSSDGKLYCLDAIGSEGSTSVLWQYDIHSTWSSPAITNDRLYIGSKDNSIYCFNLTQTPGSEEFLWQYDILGDVDSSPAVSSGKVYVGTHGSGGRLYSFGSYVESPKDRIILKQGWNLISIPAIQEEQSLTKVLENISGKYDSVQYYNESDASDPWKHYKVGKSMGNDLTQINEKMGLWIHITSSGNTFFPYNGTQPTSNQTITLHSGWNLVGYPSLTSYNRIQGLNNLTFGSEIEAIWTYDAATQMWIHIDESDNFEIGKGYWIFATTECEWEVPL